VKGTKTRTNKTEGRESKNPDRTGSMKGVPGYLERERESAKERKMMARFRCGNEETENRYWMEGEERRCRMCNEERETMEHMWNGCSEMRKDWRIENSSLFNEFVCKLGLFSHKWGIIKRE
jgi:hypothetical protein